ncbi:hypothetical protein D9M72_636050 [compost metagenome]
MAITAVAIPLWEATTGGGTKNLNMHGQYSQSVVAVARQLKSAPANWGKSGGTECMPWTASSATAMSAVGEVHGYFKANTQVGVGRFDPHVRVPRCVD